MFRFTCILILVTSLSAMADDAAKPVDEKAETERIQKLIKSTQVDISEIAMKSVKVSSSCKEDNKELKDEIEVLAANDAFDQKLWSQGLGIFARMPKADPDVERLIQEYKMSSGSSVYESAAMKSLEMDGWCLATQAFTLYSKMMGGAKGDKAEAEKLNELSKAANSYYFSPGRRPNMAHLTIGISAAYLMASVQKKSEQVKKLDQILRKMKIHNKNVSLDLEKRVGENKTTSQNKAFKSILFSEMDKARGFRDEVVKVLGN